jgi:hypothetical protein
MPSNGSRPWVPMSRTRGEQIIEYFLKVSLDQFQKNVYIPTTYPQVEDADTSWVDEEEIG